jgi:hypothetical protein
MNTKLPLGTLGSELIRGLDNLECRHAFSFTGVLTDGGEKIEYCQLCDATRDSSGGIIE